MEKGTQAVDTIKRIHFGIQAIRQRLTTAHPFALTEENFIHCKHFIHRKRFAVVLQ